MTRCPFDFGCSIARNRRECRALRMQARYGRIPGFLALCPWKPLLAGPESLGRARDAESRPLPTAFELGSDGQCGSAFPGRVPIFEMDEKCSKALKIC